MGIREEDRLQRYIRRKGVRAYGHKGRRQATKVYKVQRRKGVKA